MTKTNKMLLSFFLAAIVAISQASNYALITNQIHLLRPQSGSGGSYVDGISCLSWRLGIETNNIIGWSKIPDSCIDYVGHYMYGSQYRLDSQVVTEQALLYAKSLNFASNGKDLWIFDIDETALSNLPYYADQGFGKKPYNSTAFDGWVLKGEAPSLPESLKLYQELLPLGFKIAFLTGRHEDQRNVTSANLKTAGFHIWEKLILKGPDYSGKTALVYKSAERKKLEDIDGYRIIGNVGDQWSDLLGTNPGNRTFKLPDPMYYVS